MSAELNASHGIVERLKDTLAEVSTCSRGRAPQTLPKCT